MTRRMELVFLNNREGFIDAQLWQAMANSTQR
jgi:hypothetical protein